MPELAEVAYCAGCWSPGLRQKVLRVQVNERARVFRDQPEPGALVRELAGQPLSEIRTHGKQMLFRLGTDRWLLGHLGMSGEMSARPADFTPGRHDHLVLFQKQRALAFTDPRMFGRWRLFVGPQEPDEWAGLPPEIVSARFTKPLLASALQRHRRAPLKAVLLRQEICPGIGNWMADEVLWRARLHPVRLAGSLSAKETGELWKCLREICRQAMKIIAPGTADGWGDPLDSWLFSHRWEPGGHCPQCGTDLARATVGGRTTAWCPRCQKP